MLQRRTQQFHLIFFSKLTWFQFSPAFPTCPHTNHRCCNQLDCRERYQSVQRNKSRSRLVLGVLGQQKTVRHLVVCTTETERHHGHLRLRPSVWCLRGWVFALCKQHASLEQYWNHFSSSFTFVRRHRSGLVVSRLPNNLDWRLLSWRRCNRYRSNQGRHSIKSRCDCSV